MPARSDLPADLRRPNAGEQQDVQRNSGFSRRGFLAGAATATGAALATGLLRPSGAVAAERTSKATQTTGVRAFLTLEGQSIGYLDSARGGDAVGQVVDEAPDDLGVVKKHIGGVSFEDITLGCSLGLAGPLYEWIDETWAGRPEALSGSIVVSATDASRSVKSVIEFTEAYLTSTVIPNLRADSSDPAFLQLTLSPRQVSVTAPGGSSPAAASGTTWRSSNFRLQVRGLDASRVASIGSLAVTRTLDADRVPGPLEIGNLELSLSETGASSWAAWAEDFLVNGNSSDENERRGRLNFLAPNLSTVLGYVSFSQLGPVAIRRPAIVSSSNAIRRFQAELYCESVRFTRP